MKFTYISSLQTKKKGTRNSHRLNEIQSHMCTCCLSACVCVCAKGDRFPLSEAASSFADTARESWEKWLAQRQISLLKELACDTKNVYVIPLKRRSCWLLSRIALTPNVHVSTSRYAFFLSPFSSGWLFILSIIFHQFFSRFVQPRRTLRELGTNRASTCQLNIHFCICLYKYVDSRVSLWNASVYKIVRHLTISRFEYPIDFIE